MFPTEMIYLRYECINCVDEFEIWQANFSLSACLLFVIGRTTLSARM